MELKLIIGDKDSPYKDSATKVKMQNTQNVNFFYIINSLVNPLNDVDKSSYTTLLTKYKENGLVLLNYDQSSQRFSANQEKFGITTVPLEEYLGGVSIYRKEIWYEYDENYKTIVAKEEPFYHVVADNTTAGTIIDYNVGNNRYYKYLYRFIYTDEDENIYSRIGLKEIIAPIQIKWNGWTLSELHEVEYSNGKKYSTSLDDTWKFKFNISSGQQTQNIARTQQDTLGMYPRFSQGLKNVISGNVTCLLGRDVVIANYSSTKYAYEKTTDKSGNIVKWSWQPYDTGNVTNLGGYQEKLHSNTTYVDATSNSSLDLLDKWREFCYSGNPKLLRDAKGQRFIVQVHDLSNTTKDTWNRRPEEISFNWTQIADADDVIITEEF